MTKREYVLKALSHQASDKVPYCIRLTVEGYAVYGEQLLKDFYDREVQDDLKEGRISFHQAVDLSIGNFMADVGVPWWTWDMDNLPACYTDPYEAPDVMPGIIRFDSEEEIAKFYENTRYIAEKYQTFNTSLIWGSHWEKAYFTRGIENFLADLAAFPEFAQKLLDYIIRD